MTMDFSAERLSYEKGSLNESDLPNNPFDLLTEWIRQAQAENVPEPYAISLATANADNQPSVRTLLVREITTQGIIFYTNYDSAKGQDLAHNPQAQALFFWHSLERQVRLTGKIRKIDPKQSTDYFHKRPRDSQIAAWVSQPQSGTVADRPTIEAKFADLKAQYADDSPVPRPEFWGGYELIADKIEFWQGRANRMHDRIVFNKTANTNWQIQRLLP